MDNQEMTVQTVQAAEVLAEQNNIPRENHLGKGMFFGVLAGAVGMFILGYFGYYILGGLCVGLGIFLGMAIGSKVRKKTRK